MLFEHHTMQLWILILLVLVVVWFIFLRKRNLLTDKQNILVANQDKISKQASPNLIAIGNNPKAPIVTIEALTTTDHFETAQVLDVKNNTSLSRLSALCQSIPSLLIANESNGKQIMEVVINGDLVRAADGNGLRAFAINADGIQEHAKLFEIQNLQNMINAAAIWQIASVVVAQKHLADISKKLDEIKDGITGISRFLDNQRKSRVKATYSYLEQVYHAIQNGELPQMSRNQLEICEHDLLEIQNHLEMEFKQKVDKKIEHSEMFGTKELEKDLSEKVLEIDHLAEEIIFCIKTRIATWHIFSLFPGETQLKIARRESIQKSIENYTSLGLDFENHIGYEISNIKAFWNTEKTLETRKQNLLNTRDRIMEKTKQHAYLGSQAIEKSEQLMLSNDRPTNLLLQFENGVLIEARQRA